ncbi:MAG: cytochrome c maturation protein CcmE, partial [Chloroflexota bacterium]|nr:cytochrome c maturation protein CcmE [Chloroflexota bacterium]
IVRSAESQDVRFQVEDESGRLTVVYAGVLSDIFGDHVQVVVEGKQGQDGVYYADQVFAKCPSRFEEATPTGGDYAQSG